MKTALGRPRPAPSFRVLLQTELARRCAENPRYSLRAFARRLGMHHATLSQILRGERPLTSRAIEELGAALGLSEQAIHDHVESEPPLARRSRREVTELACAAAEVLRDWYHFAILELIQVESFRPDVHWIAQVLGLTTDEVNEALSRLLRLRLLEMRGAEWIDLSGDAVTHFDDFTHAAVERFLEQLRALAARSLTQGESAQRSHGVTVLAIDSKKLPQATAAIEKFRGELAALLSGEAPDAVAHLEIHLFPVTRGAE